METHEAKKIAKAKGIARDVVVRALDGRDLGTEEFLEEYNLTPKEAVEIMESSDYRRELKAALDRIGVDMTYLSGKIKDLMDNEDWRAMNAGITHLMKLVGGYAPVESSQTVKSTVDHTFKMDGGDYLEYLKEKNRGRDIVEVVE
jgi:hypothetical protein